MILNITQHNASQEQIEAGVVEPKEKEWIKSALTFDAIPNSSQLEARAETLAQYASANEFKSAMIGGAPFFMAPLERALIKYGVRPLYAFSVRESVDEVQADGTTVKRAVFHHIGFVGSEYAET